MTSSNSDETRVTARVSTSVKQTLLEAASLSGATLNQFLVQASLKEAQKILAAERAITLSGRDADKIFQLVENPPAINHNLKAAIARHKDFFGQQPPT